MEEKLSWERPWVTKILNPDAVKRAASEKEASSCWESFRKFVKKDWDPKSQFPLTATMHGGMAFLSSESADAMEKHSVRSERPSPQKQNPSQAFPCLRKIRCSIDTLPWLSDTTKIVELSEFFNFSKSSSDPKNDEAG